MTLTPQYLDEKQAHLMRKGRCFSCKEKGHTVYDCLRKGKIAAISEGLIEDNSSQEKE